MSPWRYLLRSLAWHWRSHLAAALGAAVATAALAGALLTGSSVRESLRGLVLERLGNTGHVLISRGFFPAELARAFRPDFPATALIGLEGSAAHEASKRRAPVDVYGIDDSFYRFHGRQAVAPSGRDALLSPALAAEFGAKAGDTILLRVEEPSAIPREFLYGRKDETARTLRFRVGDRISPAALAEFAPRPRQGEVRAVFVPLARLQRELKVDGQVNTLLLGGGSASTEGALAQRLRLSFRLEDAGLRLRPRQGSDEMVLEHTSTILDDRTAERALEVGRALGILTRPSLVYLANSIAIHGRRIPYSLVAAVDDATLAEVNSDLPLPPTSRPPVVLNQWAATDLGAKLGDTVTLDYFVWAANGELQSESAEFQLAAITPISGLAADRDLAPTYPGISDRASLSGWDPPFPIDLKRVRPRDEQYWQLYRTTPKAWVPIETGRKLWGTRFGSYTSIRFAIGDPRLAGVLRDGIDPLASQFSLIPVRRQSLEASSGSTDFGEYFLYFSFFVLVSALLLMALFFRLGVERRRQETGLLRALGFSEAAVRRLFLTEGLLVAAAGSILGALLAPVWAGLILHGLRTWWSGATGTRLLRLEWNPALLGAGCLAGLLVAAFAIWQALRKWDGLSPRALYFTAAERPAGRWLPAVSWGAAGAALLLLALSLMKWMPAAGAFFGAGFLLLVAFLCRASLWLRQPRFALTGIPGRGALAGLALRNAAWRPGRTLLCLALIAPAAFLLVALESFRPTGAGNTAGYTLYAESLAPLIPDPNTVQGREALNLPAAPALRWTRFRLRPGDDVSCLNLYRPRNPRILGVPAEFAARRPFQFAGSTGESPETLADPWLLLDVQMNRGVIPAIVDQNSLQYVLHKKLGDEIELEREGSPPLRLLLVASLQGSPFQSEILISEKSFKRLFPQVAGWRVFLIEGPASAQGALEESLSDYDFDAQTVAERLAGYHRVEDTYLSTFQALGAFGLLLGTIGLAAVLLRNTLERRRELALLRAAGFGERQLQQVILLETAAVLAAGLLAGALCALLAVAPALVQRGSGIPVAAVAGMLILILAGGLVAAWVAARAALRGPLVAALRSE